MNEKAVRLIIAAVRASSKKARDGGPGSGPHKGGAGSPSDPEFHRQRPTGPGSAADPEFHRQQKQKSGGAGSPSDPEFHRQRPSGPGSSADPDYSRNRR